MLPNALSKRKEGKSPHFESVQPSTTRLTSDMPVAQRRTVLGEEAINL